MVSVAADEGKSLPSGVVTFLFTDIEGSTLLLRRLVTRTKRSWPIIIG